MRTVCRAYLIANGMAKAFIVNMSNLPAFLNQHQDIDEIVVVGKMEHYFVLNCKKGEMFFCSDSIVKESIERELVNIQQHKELNLIVYKAFLKSIYQQSVHIYSTSLVQAVEDIEQWTMIPCRKVITVA